MPSESKSSMTLQVPPEASRDLLRGHSLLVKHLYSEGQLLLMLKRENLKYSDGAVLCIKLGLSARWTRQYIATGYCLLINSNIQNLFVAIFKLAKKPEMKGRLAVAFSNARVDS